MDRIGLLICVYAFSLSFSYRLSEEFHAQRVVYKPVEDSVSDRFFSYNIMPTFYGELRSYHSGALLVAILYDIHQYAARLHIEGLHPEVIEDQQVGPLDTLELRKYRTFYLGYLKLAHQLGCTCVQHPEAILTRPVAKCRGKIAFAGAGGSGDKQVLILANELHGGKPFDLVTVQTALKAVV